MINSSAQDQHAYKEARFKLIIISVTFITFVAARVLVSSIAIIVSDKLSLDAINMKSFLYFLIFELVLISLVIYVDFKNLYEATE